MTVSFARICLDKRRRSRRKPLIDINGILAKVVCVLAKTDGKKEIITAALAKLIGSGEYEPGMRLPPERLLAKEFGTSRNILREAMISLEAMGVIEKKERLGVFVKGPSTAEDIMQNLKYMQLPPVEFMPMQMEVRMMICVPAVELAAIRRTDEDLEKLWSCYEEFSKSYPSETAAAEGEIANAKWEALLHHLETEAAHNALLTRINESIASLVEKNNAFVHRKLTIRDESWFEHIKQQHRKIIAAIESNNPHLAGKTLREHFVDSYNAMKKNYPQYLLDKSRIYWEAIEQKD